MSELRLAGCRPEPLGSYLKALGVLRLVGEQIDDQVTGRWHGDGFVLSGPLDPDGLVAFLVDDYLPTPLVAPWNGGSGFGPKDKQEGIAAIEASETQRLGGYRRAIALARSLRGGPDWEAASKEEQVQRCRAVLPDEAVAWIDATVVLTNDSPVFPPLLGTGGNDGRLEFSNNFMQRLVETLDLQAGWGTTGRDTSAAWLRGALMAEAGARLVAKVPVGQFDPAAAGGVNSSPTGSAQSLVNPWDYILLLEGALLFASGAARRLGARGRGSAAMPFMVGASPTGYPTGAPGEVTRGEFWAPLWSRPATLAEVVRLLGEGRAAWRRSQASTGLDVARATASLGVDRGIDSFVRHAFAQRLGLSFLAVPVGRIEVRTKPEVPVLGQLDPWVGRLRRAKSMPAGAATALRRLDGAQFEVSLRGGALRLQEVLVAAAELEVAVGRSAGLREQTGRPVQGLRAADWLPVLDDGSPELRLAAAVASQADPLSGAQLSRFDKHSTSPALLLRAVRRAGPRALEWSQQAPRVSGHRILPVVEVLANLLVRRMIDVTGRTQADDGHEAGQVGVQPAFQFGLRAPLSDVAALVDGRLDEGRLDRLLAAFVLLDWRPGSRYPSRTTSVKLDTSRWPKLAGPLNSPAPALWALLAPFFHGPPIDPGDGFARRLRPSAGWPYLLLTGKAARVAEEALGRLRIARLDPAPTCARALGGTGDRAAGARLAAALVCPLSKSSVSALLRRVVPEPIAHPSTEEETTDA